MKIAAILALHSPVVVFAASSSHSHVHDQCKDFKSFYQDKSCCGNPDDHTGHQIIPMKHGNNKFNMYSNSCHGKKQNMSDVDCFKDNLVSVLEQAGADVTKGVKGTYNSSVVPLTTQYFEEGLCPVNVHWHLGAEHRSGGQYEEAFVNQGPTDSGSTERRGFRCNHYSAGDTKFTKQYKWKYCSNMTVGETYEVHWPHSKLGACGTSDQYQTPFYDGVFCNYASSVTSQQLAHAVGVQAQVFTIVNDEDYYYPDLIRGMIKEGDYGKEITYYTGSTTGTKRSNSKCSKYSPITWQVDRTCHLISASSVDKMCADMRAQKDDMSSDTHPHGARELVWANLTADNHEYRRLGDVVFQIDAIKYA